MNTIVVFTDGRVPQVYESVNLNILIPTLLYY